MRSGEILSSAGAASHATAQDRKLSHAAHQFEAMFMTEMLRLARPQNKASGPFASGSGEKSWQVFMDQALGEAAVAKGGTGLVRVIEKAMRDAGGGSPGHDSKGTGR